MPGADPNAVNTLATTTQEGVNQAVLSEGLNQAAVTAVPTTTALATPTLAAPGSTSFWQGANSAAVPTQAVAAAPVTSSANLIPVRDLANSSLNLSGEAAQQGIAAAKPGLMDRISTGYGNLSTPAKIGVGIGGGALLSSAMAPSGVDELDDEYNGPLSKFKYDPNKFNASRITPNVYRPGYAQGGIAALAGGGYPMGRQNNTQFATSSQMPTSSAVINADYEQVTNPYTGEPVEMAMGGKTGMGQYGINNAGAIFNSFGRAGGQAAPKHNPLANFQPTRNVNAGRPTGSHVYNPKYAEGGIAGYSLGGYAAGGNPRLLKGPGDGMSDDIPATIANKQPARLADGEFVVPADVVSHLGNGSTDAGAKHLYKMMDKVRKARTGKKAQGKQIKSERFLPA
jgi:hypothetical protein